MLLFQWALSQENWDEVFVNARVPRPSSLTLAGGGELLEKDHQKSGCFSQVQFGELSNEGLFRALEKSLSYCFIEDDL